MVRGLIVGGTDYSHQSLPDMLVDLEKWIEGIEETIELIKTTIYDLNQIGKWSNCDYDFRSICGYSNKFFNTAVHDLKDVIEGIHSEIQEYHVNVLLTLSTTAHDTNEMAKKIWSEYPNKEYGDPIFKKIEALHYELCNMTGDMFDLNNLAHRIKNFVGRKVKSMGNDAKVNNVFNAPVTGMQQNFDNSTGTQNIGSNTIELDNLRASILEIKELLKNVSKDNKMEIEESLTDLEEAIENNDTKKSKIKAFGGIIINGLKKLLTLQTFDNIEKISAKLPQVTENFEKVLHNMTN